MTVNRKHGLGHTQRDSGDDGAQDTWLRPHPETQVMMVHRTHGKHLPVLSLNFFLGRSRNGDLNKNQKVSTSGDQGAIQEVGRRAQLVKCMVGKHDIFILDPRTHKRSQGLVKQR